MNMNSYPLVEIEHLTQDTFKIRVNKPDIPIKSGQCFNVGLDTLGINREYSMYSSADSKYLDFLIRSTEGGVISSALQKLNVGDFVEIDGAYGEFCLNEPISTKQKYLFIATGTGIAPFHSFVQTWPEINYTLIHGIRHEDEQYHFGDYSQGCYHACISKPSDGSDSFRVTDYLLQNELSKDTLVYICGNRNMIVDSFEILHSKGVTGDKIVTEVFF
jgi:ferredoxin/flavodoxin---NADP+ reductase